MAKTSMINRDIKRKKMVLKFAAKRAELKAIVANPKSSYEEKMEAQTKLQKLPRDASPSSSAQSL
jgi:small subunit ribosomal protein S14